MSAGAGPRLLFVYGTLRRDSPDSRNAMLGAARLVGAARMRGRLYALGGYPGFVPERDAAAWVHGEVYELADSRATLARLDAYEGCGPRDPEPHEYGRELAEVVLADGARAEAWVYVYRGPLAGKPLIVSGDYCQPQESDAAAHRRGVGPAP